MKRVTCMFRKRIILGVQVHPVEKKRNFFRLIWRHSNTSHSHRTTIKHKETHDGDRAKEAQTKTILPQSLLVISVENPPTDLPLSN